MRQFKVGDKVRRNPDHYRHTSCDEIFEVAALGGHGTQLSISLKEKPGTYFYEWAYLMVEPALSMADGATEYEEIMLAQEVVHGNT